VAIWWDPSLSQPAVSKHLKVLARRRLVRPAPTRSAGSTGSGPSRCGRSTSGWRPYRQKWAGHLNALERHLEIMDGSRGVIEDELGT